MKQSKSSLRSDSITNAASSSSKGEKAAYIERRKRKTSGVKICDKCGGVIWLIDNVKICGDSRCKK